jgi:Siphovirus ReqiPepy6 Gp37-like protein
MELFRFIWNGVADQETVLENGQAINGAQSIKWVERYREPGEFEIKAKLSSGLLDFLPLDTFISHINTYEVMIVENHEIIESEDADTDIVITGRSFDSYLEHRFVGTNQARDFVYTNYGIWANYTWHQAVTLINDHIIIPLPGDQLVNVTAFTSLTGTGVSETRSVRRMPVLTALNNLLSVDDLGVRTIRRNTFGLYGSNAYTYYEIYKGIDKTASVVFSWKRGEIIGADYLWTNKNYKTSCMVASSYFALVVDGPINGQPAVTKYKRRMMFLDASDLDSQYDTKPVYPIYDDIIAAMRSRGWNALRNQKKVRITRADIAPLTNFIYRRDYNLGDLVLLDGNFGVTQVMRVIEHVEIQDETGSSGHPTLSVPIA